MQGIGVARRNFGALLTLVARGIENEWAGPDYKQSYLCTKVSFDNIKCILKLKHPNQKLNSSAEKSTRQTKICVAASRGWNVSKLLIDI